MKRFLDLLRTGIFLLFSFLLISCAYRGNPYQNIDLSQETWQREIITDPRIFAAGADSWFITGDPNSAEIADSRAPDTVAISTMTVNVADDFANIKVDGAFQVQIFGTDEHNSVAIYGPNVAVRGIAVEIRHGTLYLRQVADVSPNLMKHVIVRIGIRVLNNLTQMGCGTIEAIQVRSPLLNITATPTASGNIYLAGHVNLRHVTQLGHGSINVFGAITPLLDVYSSGTGAVNVGGNIGIRSIDHRNMGDVNIVGANSGSLTIYAQGIGKIGVDGVVCLKDVTTRDRVRVYLCNVRSNRINANLNDRSIVGLSGMVGDLYVNTSFSSRFYGRYLCALNAYVRSYGSSHINVNANNRVFASASGSSSIYFFGPSNLISEFDSSSGAIISMGRSSCNFASEFRPYSYTLEPRGRLAMVHRRHVMDYKGELMG